MALTTSNPWDTPSPLSGGGVTSPTDDGGYGQWWVGGSGESTSGSIPSGGGGAVGSGQQVTVSTCTAKFTYTIYADGIVTFVSKSTGSISSLLWSFGDGTYSKTSSVLHQYVGAGTFNVTLKVSNATGQSSYTQLVTIESTPIPTTVDFTYVVGALAVQCTDISTASGMRTWNFGDGQISYDINPYHVYVLAGTYTVTLTISGRAKSQQVIAQNEQAPSGVDGNCLYSIGSAGTGDGQFLSAGYMVADLDNIYVVDAGNYRVQVFSKSTFAFVDKFGSAGSGDGQFYSGNTFSVANTADYIYVADYFQDRIIVFNKTDYSFVVNISTAGKYIFAVFTDAENIYGIPLSQDRGYVCDLYSEAIIMLPNAPSASFSADVTSGAAPLTVQFTDLSSDNPTSWLWEFGDGGISTSQDPSHVFSAGIWTVRLTATNDQGSSSYVMTIIASSTPVFTPPEGGTVTPGGSIPGQTIASLLGKIGYYAVDTLNNEVLIYAANGSLLKTFGGIGNTGGKFWAPTTCSVINGKQRLDRVVIEQE